MNNTNKLKHVLRLKKKKKLYNFIFFFYSALFWNLEPSKTLSDHYISSIKKSKNHITVVLTCNTDGSHKLPALVIHK
jgi:hypothetical protein